MRGNYSTILDRYAPPGGGQITERTDREAFVRRMLADKTAADKRMKMTWSKDRPPLVPMDNIVGEVNLNLPHCWINRAYYIQNGNIYRSNGVDKLSLEQVGTEDPANYKWVKQAFESFKKDALRRDANLCLRCVESDVFYRFEGSDDATRHNVQAHPEMIQEALGLTPSSGHVTTEAEPVPVKKEDFSCCGKGYQLKQQLTAHRRFSKTCPHKTSKV